jgi:hypothetical protein
MNLCEIYDRSRFRQEEGIMKTLHGRSHITMRLRTRESAEPLAHMGAQHSSESQSHQHQHPTPGIVVEWPIYIPKGLLTYLDISWHISRPQPFPSPEAQASARRFTQRGNAGVLWHLSTSLGHIRRWLPKIHGKYATPNMDIYVYVYINILYLSIYLSIYICILYIICT